MPMWTCDFGDCSKPAVRKDGDCVLCDRHLCSKHLQPEFHDCPHWRQWREHEVAFPKAEELEIKKLIDKIDTRALAARASQLRDGVPCSVPQPRFDKETQSEVMGGVNYHVDVCFEDGVTWIARVRRLNANAPPPALRDYVFKSEVATLMFLEKTNLPVPKVYDYALEGADNNPVGVGYILMEKLPGTPLGAPILSSGEDMKKILGQLADFYIELHKYPFSTLGSLDTPGKDHVGAFAREKLTDFVRGEMHLVEPCTSWQEYQVSRVRLILDLIVRDEMYARRPVDAYLLHRFLLDLVPVIFPATQAGDAFYLKHADDKGDHILVDADNNITGLIDWEWAHTAPASHAFNTPLGVFDVGPFFRGSNDLGANEVALAEMLEARGRPDLAQSVRGSKVQHRFAFCCGHDLEDWHLFLVLFKALRDGAGVDAGMGWEEWKGVAMGRYEDDAGLQKLLNRQ